MLGKYSTIERVVICLVKRSQQWESIFFLRMKGKAIYYIFCRARASTTVSSTIITSAFPLISIGYLKQKATLSVPPFLLLNM
jgi:hypothetical protein